METKKKKTSLHSLTYFRLLLTRKKQKQSLSSSSKKLKLGMIITIIYIKLKKKSYQCLKELKS